MPFIIPVKTRDQVDELIYEVQYVLRDSIGEKGNYLVVWSSGLLNVLEGKLLEKCPGNYERPTQYPNRDTLIVRFNNTKPVPSNLLLFEDGTLGYQVDVAFPLDLDIWKNLFINERYLVTEFDARKQEWIVKVSEDANLIERWDIIEYAEEIAATLIEAKYASNVLQ